MPIINEVSVFAKTLTDKGIKPDDILSAFLLYACSVMVFSNMTDPEIHKFFTEALHEAQNLQASGNLVAAPVPKT